MAGRRVTFSQFRGDDPLRAKMVGVGSAGCNMLARSPIETTAISSSQADLDRSGATEKALISPQKLVGLAQTAPSVVKQMPSIIADELRVSFKETDVVFIMAGLGGLTGSVGTAVVSSFARASGVFSVALAASPFSAESERRRKLAALYSGRISQDVDLLVEFGNDALAELAPNMPLSRAFSVMNGIMHRPVIDILEAGTRKDLKVLREVVGDSVVGRMGLGIAKGDERVQRVVNEALSSPWMDFPAEETDAAVVVYSTSDPWDREFGEIVELLQSRLGEARMIHGSYSDASLGDRIRLSLILCRRPYAEVR